MSKMQNQRQQQAKLARLEIVSQMYLRQCTVRQIRAEVMKRLGLKTYSTATVQSDIKTLLEELQQQRLDNVEYALQLELERIDVACRELWEQWDKSKKDRVRTSNKGDGKKREVIKHEGNVAYIAEIRQQLQERRKLMGLYAPEKQEIKATTELTREELEQELRRLEILTSD